MRVFIVDQSFFGLLYDVQFATALAETGAEVTLIGRPLRSYEEMNGSGFRHLPLFYRFSEGLPQRLRPLAPLVKGAEHVSGMAALVDLVRRERPDVVHFEWIVLPFVDTWFLPRLARLVPLVLTVHNSVPYHGASSSKLMLEGHQKALRTFRHFIPHTEKIRDHLLGSGIPVSRMDLLPHPAVRLPRDPEAAARAVGRPPGAPVEILFFGAIKPYKGVDILIEAAGLLARRRQDFHVTICGKPFIDLGPLQAPLAGPLAARVTLEARHLSEAELSARMEAADIIVFPYREIDASGAFACASKFGKAIVASELGVFAEAPVREHIDLVPAGDVVALAEALEQLIAEPARRAHWAERAVALDRMTYSWERFAKDCTSIYERLIAGDARGVTPSAARSGS
jgi:glycosyltransferase involved in cell wall biosynthesis